MKQDGSSYQVLVPDLNEAFAVDYHYKYALTSYVYFPTYKASLSSVTNHSPSFLCSMNKMFWTSVTDGKVYEAQLDNEHDPKSIVDNVDSPRETL